MRKLKKRRHFLKGSGPKGGLALLAPGALKRRLASGAAMGAGSPILG